MKTIMASLFLAMLCASANAGGLRGNAIVESSSCTTIRQGKQCKKRNDCAWHKPLKKQPGTCKPKKVSGGNGNSNPPAGPPPPAQRCPGLHDHTTPLAGVAPPFAWKTKADGSRNAYNRFAGRIAQSCCDVPATEATTFTWAEFVAGQNPWCVANKPVTIPCGTKVLMGGTAAADRTIALKGLYVEGELEFVDAGGDLELRTDFVLNCGVLRAGAPGRRYASKLDIVLTGETELWWRGSSFGKAGFVTHGGETYLRSASCDKTTWTHLAADADAGARELTVRVDTSLAADTAWRVGDQLLVTTTGFHVKSPKHVQSEVVTIAGFKADGRTVELAAPGLRHKHLGCGAAAGGGAGGGRSAAGCVMAAEVAPLSRNVQVRGEDASAGRQRGGHFMMSHTNHGTICGVEFGPFLGQRITKGKYPLHFHAGWNAPELVVKSNAVHHSFNRGMVVHAMRNMVIVDNTVYDTLGHNFMLEDGVEERNKLEHNLGVLPRSVDWRPSKGCCAHAPADDDGDNDGPEGNGDNDDDENDGGEGGLRRLASFQQRAKEDAARCPGVTKDTCGNRSDGVPNAFWIPNPRNALIDNTGVAELGKAFRIETRSVVGDTVLWFQPEARNVGRKGKIKNVVPMGFSAKDEAGALKFFGFAGNTAHSSSIGFLNYPMLRPGGPRAAQYDRYTAWRNHMGISVRNSGRPLKITGATLVENNYAVLAHIFKSRVAVTDSKIVRSRGKNSLPFKMKKTKNVQKTLAAIKADEGTKTWARDHGGFTHKDATILLKASTSM